MRKDSSPPRVACPPVRSFLASSRCLGQLFGVRLPTQRTIANASQNGSSPKRLRSVLPPRTMRLSRAGGRLALGFRCCFAATHPLLQPSPCHSFAATLQGGSRVLISPHGKKKSPSPPRPPLKLRYTYLT